jgi:hypothetical protein
MILERWNFPPASSSHIGTLNMKNSHLLGGALVGLALALTGCETRSISDSGYNRDRYESTGYRGELTEFDVLGVDNVSNVSDADITAELKNSKGARLQRNSKILLIQSGADFPDAAMAEAMSQHLAVTTFSGKPETDRVARPSWETMPSTQVAASNEPKLSYSKSLRLTAARGGYDKIVCYWGVLESERKNEATKFVSWVPIVGYAFPDERENMRIRLKAVIIDVATGRWTFVTPKLVESTGLSSIYSREDKDQALVADLKDQSYKDLARLLTDAYMD